MTLTSFASQQQIKEKGNTQNKKKKKHRILFASCNNQDYLQPIWSRLEAREANAFIWAGDAIYADQNIGTDWSTFPPVPQIQEANVQQLYQYYNKQLNNENYTRFRQSIPNILGTWDDHDYGANNGDILYRWKRESAIAFVQYFLGIDNHTATTTTSLFLQRAQRGEGVYGAFIFDFEREHGKELLSDHEANIDPDLYRQTNDTSTSSTTTATNYNNNSLYFNSSLIWSPNQLDQHEQQPRYSTTHSVAVFLLDVRSFKTPWKQGSAKYFQNFEGDFLGPHQWAWFERALANSKASVNIIVNGLQIHGDKFWDGNVGEAWGRFPNAQNKLYNTILESGVAAPILISGDVHQAELSRKDCARQTTTTDDDDRPKIRSLVEMTTSGLTHSWGSRFCSRADTSFMCKSPHTTWATGNAIAFGHYINPWNEIIQSESSPLSLQYSLEFNFGELEFDFENRTVDMRIHGMDFKRPLLQLQFTMDELSGHVKVGGKSRVKDFGLVQDQAGPWICAHYRGVPGVAHQLVAQVISLGTITMLMFLPFLVTGLVILFSVRRIFGTFSIRSKDSKMK